jgi:hypothetical protein
VGGEAPVTPVSSPDSSSLDLSYKPCDNILAPLPGNTESTFLNDISLVSLASEYFLVSLPGDSTTFSPYSLVVSGKLSGDSTDDESTNDPTSNFTMGPWEF